jgi:hypothetical protein
MGRFDGVSCASITCSLLGPDDGIQPGYVAQPESIAPAAKYNTHALKRRENKLDITVFPPKIFFHYSTTHFERRHAWATILTALLPNENLPLVGADILGIVALASRVFSFR